MDEIFLFSTVIMTGISGLLLIVSIASLYRLKHLKLMFVSLAFLFFLIKAMLLLTEFIVQDRYAVIIDTIILILLYFTVIKKS